MRQTSPDFQRLWDRYDVDLYVTGSQTLLHPQVGELTIEYQVLRIEGQGGLTMLTYHAEQRSPEYDAFVRLDS